MIIITAEIGLNWQGDIEIAKDMVWAAKEAGCDQVKFQFYRTKDFILDDSITWQGQRQWDMFKRCEMNIHQLVELAVHTEKVGIGWHATPTNKQYVDILQGMGCKYVKNGSDFGSQFDLLRYMHHSGMQPIVSTGLRNAKELTDMVIACPSAIFLHCTSEYPCPPEHTNIARMRTMAGMALHRIGFSDHTQGSTAAVLAVGAGAVWIEKHFTLDNDMEGPDHKFSVNPSGLKHYVEDIRVAEVYMGDQFIRPTKEEERMRKEWKGKRVI